MKTQYETLDLTTFWGCLIKCVSGGRLEAFNLQLSEFKHTGIEKNDAVGNRVEKDTINSDIEDLKNTSSSKSRLC